MKPVAQWRRSWRWLSVQAGALAVLWGTTSAETQAAILALVGVPAERVPAILGLLVIAARLIDQGEARK